MIWDRRSEAEKGIDLLEDAPVVGGAPSKLDLAELREAIGAAPRFALVDFRFALIFPPIWVRAVFIARTAGAGLVGSSALEEP